jgi:hypothetical protein
MRQDAEEFLPARIAAVSGDSEKALQEEQSAPVNPIAIDVLQVEIAASRAVRKTGKWKGHAPGVKAPIASAASPGTQLKEGTEKVRDASAMRTKTFFTSALRTNHLADQSPDWAGEEYLKPFAGARAGKVYAPRAGVSKIDAE